MNEGMKELLNALSAIQAELKAPKGQYNSFGKYNYRSCEDILNALKPLLTKNGVTLYLTDTVEQHGDRYYVVATATLTNGGYQIQSHAFAREDLNKAGMSESQITGTASSYARKYALNGLFLIDDTKDADTDEYTFQTNPKCFCEKCGAEITAYKSGKGMVSPQRHAEASKKKYGSVLCLDCIKEANGAD